jgi:hypothetical protein
VNVNVKKNGSVAIRRPGENGEMIPFHIQLTTSPLRKVIQRLHYPRFSRNKGVRSSETVLSQ